MSVLFCILKVLLGLVLAAVLIGLFLLWVRVGVEVIGVNRAVSVEIRYGVLRIPVWPRPKRSRRAAREKRMDAKPKKRRKKPKYHYSLNREALDFSELAAYALTLLGEMTDLLRISRLRVRVVIGTEDAAKTGMLLGGAAAFTGMTDIDRQRHMV